MRVRMKFHQDSGMSQIPMEHGTIKMGRMEYNPRAANTTFIDSLLNLQFLLAFLSLNNKQNSGCFSYFDFWAFGAFNVKRLWVKGQKAPKVQKADKRNDNLV